MTRYPYRYLHLNFLLGNETAKRQHQKRNNELLKLPKLINDAEEAGTVISRIENN